MLLSLTGIAVAGVLAYGGRQVLQQHRRPQQKLVNKLIFTQKAEQIATGETNQIKLAHFTNKMTRNVMASLTSLDDRYQHSLQRRIDALTRTTRHAQWQEITGDKDALTISPEDKMYNRRIACLSGVVVTAALAKLYAPFFLLTIPLASYELITRGLWVYK